MQKVIFITIVVLFTSGCSVFYQGSRVVPERESSSEVSGKSIMENNLTKDNFTIQKAEIEFIEEGKTANLIASLKYRSDGSYLISLRSRTGIEIARIYITKDTLLLNDRVNKKLYYGSSEFLQNKYGITAAAIPLIFGDLILDANEERIVQCKNGKGIIMGTINSNNITYGADCTKKKVSDIFIESYKDVSRIEIKFSSFKKVEEKIFPEIIQLVETGNKSEIKIRIKKIEFESEESLKLIPGTNYEKILIK